MSYNELNRRVRRLERLICCNKNKFFDSLSEFPNEGKPKILYVDMSTGSIYVWNGTEYITSSGGGDDAILNQIEWNGETYTEYKDSGWDKKLKVTNESIKDTVDSVIEEKGWGVNLNFLDVSDVTNMEYLFYMVLYDGDISQWDVSNVEDMNHMFYNAAFFNQDLSGWCVSNIPEEPVGFSHDTSWTLPKPVWGTCP